MHKMADQKMEVLTSGEATKRLGLTPDGARALEHAVLSKPARQQVAFDWLSGDVEHYARNREAKKHRRSQEMPRGGNQRGKRRET